MPNVLVVEYDIEPLDDREFQQFLQEVADLAIERKEQIFTPGRPLIRMKFNVSDRSFEEMGERLRAIFSEADAASVAAARLTDAHLEGLRYARGILENNPLRLGQDKVCQNHTRQCDAAIAAIDQILKGPV